MTKSTKTHSDVFYVALAAIAMIGSTSLVIAAATMPEIPATGEFMVSGHGIILAVIATALVLRVAYFWGYSKAMRSVGPESHLPVTA